METSSRLSKVLKSVRELVLSFIDHRPVADRDFYFRIFGSKKKNVYFLLFTFFFLRACQKNDGGRSRVIVGTACNRAEINRKVLRKLRPARRSYFRNVLSFR